MNTRGWGWGWMFAYSISPLHDRHRTSAIQWTVYKAAILYSKIIIFILKDLSCMYSNVPYTATGYFSRMSVLHSMCPQCAAECNSMSITPWLMWQILCLCHYCRPGWLKRVFTDFVTFTVKLVIKAQVGAEANLCTKMASLGKHELLISAPCCSS